MTTLRVSPDDEAAACMSARDMLRRSHGIEYGMSSRCGYQITVWPRRPEPRIVRRCNHPSARDHLVQLGNCREHIPALRGAHASTMPTVPCAQATTSCFPADLIG